VPFFWARNQLQRPRTAGPLLRDPDRGLASPGRRDAGGSSPRRPALIGCSPRRPAADSDRADPRSRFESRFPTPCGSLVRTHEVSSARRSPTRAEKSSFGLLRFSRANRTRSPQPVGIRKNSKNRIPTGCGRLVRFARENRDRRKDEFSSWLRVRRGPNQPPAAQGKRSAALGSDPSRWAGIVASPRQLLRQERAGSAGVSPAASRRQWGRSPPTFFEIQTGDWRPLAGETPALPALITSRRRAGEKATLPCSRKPSP